MLRIAHSTQANSRRRPAAVIPTRPSRSAAVHDAHLDAEVPERLTERWKHRVEAEARCSLLRSIRGVGAAR